MSSLVDGYGLKFVSRTQSAERRLHGRLVDSVPVAWAETWRSVPPPKEPDALPAKAGRRKAVPRDAYVAIAIRDSEEMAKLMATPRPFVIAVARQREKGESGRNLVEFRGVFEVTPTGVELSPNTIETKVIRRVVGES